MTKVITAADLVLEGEVELASFRPRTITITESIEQASSVVVTASDPKRTLLNSDEVQKRSTLLVGGLDFALQGHKTDGPDLTLTFYDLGAVELTEKTGGSPARSQAPQVGTRGQFIGKLAAEVRFGTIHVYTGGDPTEQALAVGTPDDPQESLWAATGRLAADVDWRRFVAAGDFYAGPDDWLAGLNPPLQIREHQGGIGYIDFESVAGVPVDTATFTVDTALFDIPPGHPATIHGLGHADGDWIISSLERTGGNPSTDVTLTRRRPALPEPPAEPPDTGDGPTGAGVQTSGVPGAASPAVERMVQFALSKSGGPYVWGGNGPRGYDCSGLTAAAARHAGASLVRQSMGALRQCERAGTTISVADGIRTRGALLFRARPICDENGQNCVTHIALSLGNGRTIEARGRSAGIGSFSASGRFDHAALVPGLSYR